MCVYYKGREGFKEYGFGSNWVNVIMRRIGCEGGVVLISANWLRGKQFIG